MKDLKGPSAFDQSHALMVRFQYAPPEVLAGPRALRALTRDWRISSVFLAKTGLPFSVITGSDGPGSGNVDGTNGDRPNVIDPSVLGRSIANPDTSRLLLPRSAFGFIDPTGTRGSVPGGMIWKTSRMRPMTQSTAPPKKPARAPSGMPISVLITAAPKPMASETRMA